MVTGGFITLTRNASDTKVYLEFCQGGLHNQNPPPIFSKIALNEIIYYFLELSNSSVAKIFFSDSKYDRVTTYRVFF